MDTKSDHSQKLKREYDSNFKITPEYRKSLPDVQNSGSTDMQGASDVDLVVEAIPEIPELKAEVFSNLDQICKPSAILASNTSSISINEIASTTNRPNRVIGMHFMNPVPIMKLVEIINGEHTSPEVTNLVVEAAEKMGKTALSCQDSPGFVSNNFLQFSTHFYSVVMVNISAGCITPIQWHTLCNDPDLTPHSQTPAQYTVHT